MKNCESKQSQANAPNENLQNLAFTSALYNSLATAFLMVCIALSALLLIVLSTFVRPIMWAILTGAFLFTFKFYLTEVTCAGLKAIESNRTSLSVHLFMLPFRLVDTVSEFTCSFAKQNLRNILIMLLSLVLTKFLSLFHEILFSYTIIAYKVLFSLIELFTFYADKFSMITCTLLVGYLVMLVFFWEDGYKQYLRFLSIPIWFNGFVVVSKILGSFRIYFIATFIMLISLGMFSYVKETVIHLQYKNDINGSSSSSSDLDPVAVKKESNARKSR
jgi:hypothetical protein